MRRLSGVSLTALLLLAAAASAQSNVPAVNETDSFSDLRIASLLSDLANLFVERAIYLTNSTTLLQDSTLQNVSVLKPLHVATLLDESVTGVFNGAGVRDPARSSRAGELVVENRESYAGRLGFTVTLENTDFTTLGPQAIFATLQPGSNSKPYVHTRGPSGNLALGFNTSLPQGLRFSYDETLEFRFLVQNPSASTLNATASLPLPANLTLCCSFAVQPRTPGLSYDGATNSLSWSGTLAPASNATLAFQVHLKVTDGAIAREGTLVLPLTWTVTSVSPTTVSGARVTGVDGNELFLTLVEEKRERTTEILALEETLRIPILTRLVLAFRTDSTNAQFVDAVAQARPDIYVVSASTKADFFNELRSRFYNVLWLANTGADTEAENQFTDSEIAEVQALVKAGSPIGRGLIVSGFGLKYAPGLGPILGVNYRGSLPMGNRFEVRPVEVLVDHNITKGFVDQRLEATSWFVRTEATRASVLARLADGVLPGLRLGVPFWQKQLPAITASIFGNGSGVLFAPDTGTSWQSGRSPQAWLNLTINAIDWVPSAQGSEAQLSISTRFSPPQITARQNSNGDQNKQVKVNVTLENTGASALFNLQAAEVLPAGFVLTQGSTTANFSSLAPGEAASFAFSAEVPASEAADFFLNTTVTALDSQGAAHSFSGGATLTVQLPPGAVCADPPQPQDHGKGQAKGRALKCGTFFVPSGGGSGGKPDCPPGWLKHSQTGACENPGQGGGNGGGNGNGNGNGQGGGP